MSGKRASADYQVEADYREQSGTDAERDGDGTPFDRRNYLKLVGAAVATATAGAGVSAGETSRHDITFDRVVDAVDDLGLDPSGGAPVNDQITSALSEGMLVRFPEGEYQFDGEIVIEEDRVGFLGEGDVRFVPSTGFIGRLFEHVGVPDDVLIENVDIDIRADGTTAGIRLKCRNHFHIEDVEFLGRGLTDNSGQVSAFMLALGNESGRGVLKNAVAKKGSRIDGYAGGDGRIGVWVGWSNKGTVRIEDCDFREFGNNGAYTSRTPGNVEIVDSYFLNNNGANVHVAGDGSYVENCTIEIDMQKYTGPPPENTSSGFGLRGILIDQGVQLEGAEPIPAGAEVRNCDLIGTDAPGAIAMILLSSEGRSVNVVNTRIKCDIDRMWAVRREKPGATPWREYQRTPPKPHWVRMEGVSITGSASKTEAIFLDGADDSIIRNCCIEQSGSSRDGVRIVNANGCVVENSTINVTEPRSTSRTAPRTPPRSPNRDRVPSRTRAEAPLAPTLQALTKPPNEASWRSTAVIATT